MLPFILATLGGYFIGSSLKNETSSTYDEGGGVKSLRDVYDDLRYRVSGIRLNDETKDYIYCDVRHWGNWEHDYDDYERDEEDFEDDDSMILSRDSSKRMNEIIKEISSKYPDIDINWGTSEKNYIDFQISRKSQTKEEEKMADMKIFVEKLMMKRGGKITFGEGGEIDYDKKTKYWLENELHRLQMKQMDLVFKNREWKSEERDEEIKKLQVPIDKIITLLYGKDFSGVGQKYRYALGGEIENKIDELYEKANFINSDFNWKLKLLELLQDRSIEAYQVYQSLSKKQKDEVLQELYEVDNDMGSDGDGDIKTSKENLKILLDGAKNGNKYAEGGVVDDLITKINAILQKEVPNFFHSVTKTKSYFGNEEQIAIKIAASDYEINNVRGQYPQLVSLLLNVDTMELNVQVFGGNGGQRIYRDINPNDPKEKFYAMIGIKVPFRTPQKNEKAVLSAIQKFVQNYKQALRDNIQTLRYKNNVDYETLLKN